MGLNVLRWTCLALAGASTGAMTQALAEEKGVEPKGGQPYVIEDIVVVATRREERLQDVPVTVSALSGGALSEAGIQDVRSLTQVIPAFHGGRFQTVMQPSIRGVGSSGVSVGDESNVAVYVDGVYQGDPYSTQIDMVEVSRVEVLRGPQGTVFGRNATGGLVNVITPDPSFDFSGRAEVKYGRMRANADEYDAKAYITGPITDNLAFDLAGLYREADGYTRDIFGGGTVGDTSKAYVRSKLLFQPSETSSIILTGGYVDFEDDAAYQQPYEGNTAAAGIPGGIVADEPWTTANDTIGLHAYDRLDISLRTSFELGAVDLETTSAYMRTNVHQIADSDASNLELGWTDMRVHPRTFTQEVRLLSADDGLLTWIVGAYYYHLKGRQPTFVVNNPALLQPVTPFMLDPRAKTESYSGFAEGTYEVTDSFFVTVGGRYTTEERQFSQSVNGTQLPFGEVSDRFNKFTYRIALRYNLSDKANVYASYGTGFKSGLYNTFGATPEVIRPETIKATEVGLKADPQPWLRTNVALYYYEYDDMQLNARGADNTMRLQNAADSEIYGGELEVTLLPADGLSIRAAYAYNHATFKSFPGAQGFVPNPGGGNSIIATDVSGNRLYRAPRHSGNLGANYEFEVADGRAYLAGNLFYSGKVYYDFLNTIDQESYAMVSGEAGWTTSDDRWTFKVFATNLTNEKVAQHIAPGPLATYITYERPRLVGVGVEARF